MFCSPGQEFGRDKNSHTSAILRNVGLEIDELFDPLHAKKPTRKHLTTVFRACGAEAEKPHNLWQIGGRTLFMIQGLTVYGTRSNSSG
jgi:hypothetical protein